MATKSQKLRSVAVVVAPPDKARSPCKQYFHPYGRYIIPISPYGWYRVLVYSHNSGYTIEEVLDKLRLSVSPQRLRYYYLHEGGEQDEDRDKRATFTFYVDSYKLAAKLQQKGHRPPVIGVRVSDGPPNIQVDDFYRWKLRTVIMSSSRYDPGKSCLNLCRFYADDCWKGEFCALQQFQCLEAIIEIMEQEMPQLRHLMLDSNHLSILSGFQGMEQRFSQLKSISLEHNELKSLHELRVFERLQLKKLNLRRNPLPRNYEQHLVIMFPHLRALNGQRLRWQRSSSPGEFIVSDTDIDSDVEIVSVSECKPVVLLPEPRFFYLAPHSLNMQPGIRKFVRRYLKAFDGDKRSTDLEGFYHDNTLVTLRLDKEQASWFKNTPDAAHGRQLLASRQAVLQMFEAWPKTRHLPSTMTLDLTLVQLKMLSASITGCFEETELRHYMRTFVLTRSQETDDFRIANELIYLGRAIHSRGHGPCQQSSLNPNQHNLMTKLSAETRLKSHWSCKFLKDTNWDYQQSLLAFQTLLRRRQIPNTAFHELDIQPEWCP
ncbi:nuclear RNA export factor 1-like [Drosophila innubila]|uniref:nuclear RNA export factor 1-like n=1 Tax=Drosophila innubila TaxID=198719 RepID=UPI00148C3D8C|nr:nuclear RNA export factor 1-like [Drosophila innubila]